MPRDKQGWRVAPAPDGRGMPEQHKPRPPHRLRGFWIFVLVLLALNWISVLLAQPARPAAREGAVQPVLPAAGAARARSSRSPRKGDTIQGTFTTKLRYPPSDTKATPTTLFSTQVPSFWNNDALTALLQSQGRPGQRAATRTRAPRCWPSSCSGSARRCCSSGCSCCSRAARAAGGGGDSAGSATSAARRRAGSTRRRSASPSTTSPGSTRPRPS